MKRCSVITTGWNRGVRWFNTVTIQQDISAKKGIFHNIFLSISQLQYTYNYNITVITLISADVVRFIQPALTYSFCVTLEGQTVTELCSNLKQLSNQSHFPPPFSHPPQLIIEQMCCAYSMYDNINQGWEVVCLRGHRNHTLTNCKYLWVICQ